MNRVRRFTWPLVVTASAAAMVAVFVLGIGPPISVAVALWFLGICPGVSLVRLLRIQDPLTGVIMTIALSLSIVAVASIPLLWIGTWTPARALAIVFTLTLAGAVAEVWWVGRPETVPVHMVTVPPRPIDPPPIGIDGTR